MHDGTNRIKALLCYLWVIGVVFFFTEKNNAFVRFNAAQAIVLLGVLIVCALLAWIPFIGWLLSLLITLAVLLMSVLCAINCWNGRSFRLPVIAEYADRLIRAFP